MKDDLYEMNIVSRIILIVLTFFISLSPGESFIYYSGTNIFILEFREYVTIDDCSYRIVELGGPRIYFDVIQRGETKRATAIAPKLTCQDSTGLLILENSIFQSEAKLVYLPILIR